MSLTIAFFFVVGIYLIVVGIRRSRLINESEFPATAEERRDARPSRIERLFVIGLGVASCGYGFYRIFVHQ
jgi:hypothetical protein